MPGLTRPQEASSPPVDESEGRIAELVAGCRARRPAFDVPEEAGCSALRASVAQDPDKLAALALLHADDLYLAAACARGDAAALTEFEVRVLPAAVHAAAGAGASADLTDEVAQAVRSRLFAAEKGTPPRVASYRGRASLLSWTRAVALRAASSLHADTKERRDFADDKLAALATGESVELDLMRAQLRREFRACFGAALASLPRRSRAVLRLHVVEGVTLDGLATAYGVHRGTVARWLASARSALLRRTRARLATLLKLEPGEVDSLIQIARSRLEISINGFLADTGATGPQEAASPPRRG